MLGRDESKHIICKYAGYEDDCPNTCSRCAVKYLESGDAELLLKNNYKEAMRLYKKAAFIEPKYSDAWVRIGQAYGLQREYNNALSAFEKAIAIDAQYGDALIEKANALLQLGWLEEALAIANELINLYDADCAHQLRAHLLGHGVKDRANELSLKDAIGLMTKQAHEILKSSNLLNAQGRVSTEKAIYFKEEFAERTVKLCRKTYLSYGEDKMQSESILTAFYGSICTTLFYYEDPSSFEIVFPFDYLITHIDIEKAVESAERLLGIRANETASNALWQVIYPFVQYAKSVISRVDTDAAKESALLNATESAYSMGMMYAMLWHEKRTNPNNGRSLSSRLEKVIASVSESGTDNSTWQSLSYERIPPRRTAIRMTCECCQRQVNHMIVDGYEMLFNDYQELADEFSKLGFHAIISFYCSECAKKNKILNAFGLADNFVFSISSQDGQLTAESHPAHWCFRDIEYQTAMAFLKGAASVDALAKATNTSFQPEEYIKHIHMVLGVIAKE